MEEFNKMEVFVFSLEKYLVGHTCEDAQNLDLEDV